MRSLHSFPQLSYDVLRGIPPVFSAVATEKHYKHHLDLIAKLNYLVKDTIDEDKPLEELLLKHYGSIQNFFIFKNSFFKRNMVLFLTTQLRLTIIIGYGQVLPLVVALLLIGWLP